MFVLNVSLSSKYILVIIVYYFLLFIFRGKSEPSLNIELNNFNSGKVLNFHECCFCAFLVFIHFFLMIDYGVSIIYYKRLRPLHLGKAGQKNRLKPSQYLSLKTTSPKLH